QRWVATSVQISELMHTLFADRLADEAQAEAAEKAGIGESDSLSAAGLSGASVAPTERDAASELEWEAPPGPPPKDARNKLERPGISRPEVPIAGTDPGSKIGDWEAPPGEQYIPGHRRRFGERAAAGLRSIASRPRTGEVEMTNLSSPGQDEISPRKTTK